jgi:RNA polymerase subunit RPABC4/transcription elongation factor Spt4
MIAVREFPVPIESVLEVGSSPSEAPLREVFVVIELVEMAWSKVFRCRHKKCTPLITCRKGQPRSRVAAITGTYFVCLKCGKEFAYDWDNMRVIDPEHSQMALLAEKATEMYAGK